MAISSHGVDVCLWIDSRATLCNSVCGFGSVAVLGIVGKSVTLLPQVPQFQQFERVDSIWGLLALFYVGRDFHDNRGEDLREPHIVTSLRLLFPGYNLSGLMAWSRRVYVES